MSSPRQGPRSGGGAPERGHPARRHPGLHAVAPGVEAGLLERATELEALAAVLGAARAGAGGVVVIQGAPGVGKSALLAAATERAAATRMWVGTAVGRELERDVAFGLALRLFEPVLARLGPRGRDRLLAGPAQHAVALLRGRTPPQSPPHLDLAGGVDHGAGLVHGLRALALQLAETSSPGSSSGSAAPGGLLLAIDDAHWSDTSSLRLITRLAADLPGLPVALLVTLRLDTPEAPRQLLDQLLDQPATRLLRPAVLSEPASTALVQRAYPQASEGFCRACASASGGNPFYLRELLAEVADQDIPVDTGDSVDGGAEAVASLVPDSVVRSVLRRIQALPEPAWEVATALAVLGGHTPLRQVAALARVDHLRAEQAADALAAAGILADAEPLRFAHPLIRAAVHAEIPAHARSRAHRRAAALLDEEDASAAAVAAHLLATHPERDPHTVQILRVAAEQAAARGEYPAARRFLQRALDEPPLPTERTDIAVELGLVEAATAAPDALARISTLLPTLTDPNNRARVRHALARLLFARSEFTAAAETLEDAVLDVLPEHTPAGQDSTSQEVTGQEATRQDVNAPGVGALRADQAAIAIFTPAPSPAALEYIQAVLTAARAGQPPAEPGLLAALAGWQLAQGDPAPDTVHTATAALAALADQRALDRFYGLNAGFAVVALIHLDALDDAETAIETVLGQARRTGSLIGTGFAYHWRALLRLHRGMLRGAIADAEQCLQVCASGWDVCRPWTTPILAQAHLELGDLDAADAALADDHTPTEHPAHLRTLHVRGQLALARGHPASALEHLTSAGELADRRSLTPPTMLAWRSAAALAAAALGDTVHALELAHTELDHARRIGARATLGEALRVTGLVTGGDDGLALLRQAVTVLEPSPSALLRAHTLIDFGATQRRAGQPAAARDPLRRGLEIAETLDIPPLATRARDELRAAGGRQRRTRYHTGPTALTPAERRIAALAATGTPTPQIARQLHLSPKTVEWHLANTYRKLGIRSRHQLPDALTT